MKFIVWIDSSSPPPSSLAYSSLYRSAITMNLMWEIISTVELRLKFFFSLFFFFFFFFWWASHCVLFFSSPARIPLLMSLSEELQALLCCETRTIGFGARQKHAVRGYDTDLRDKLGSFFSSIRKRSSVFILAILLITIVSCRKAKTIFIKICTLPFFFIRDTLSSNQGNYAILYCSDCWVGKDKGEIRVLELWFFPALRVRKLRICFCFWIFFRRKIWGLSKHWSLEYSNLTKLHGQQLLHFQPAFL
jgi:hypothetical protein